MTTALQLALGAQQREAAILVLADGTVFPGYSIGAPGFSVGEVVFNTAMTGYQEIVTDPSYSKQMVTLTYAHIGNTGTNAQDWESTAVHAAGLIVRDVPDCHSNFRSNDTLPAYLKKHHIVGIAGVDTRKLTRLLSTTGAQNGCIFVGTDTAAALNRDHLAFLQAREANTSAAYSTSMPPRSGAKKRDGAIASSSMSACWAP